MFVDYLQLVIPVMGLGVNVLTQVLVFRNFVKIGLLKSEYIGFLAGVLAAFLVELYVLHLQAMPVIHSAAIFVSNLVIYSSLGYVYFHFVALGETARRIRILRELYDARDGLSLEQILQRYNAKEIFENRINRLIQNGQIILRKDSYYIGNPSMLLITRIIIIFKSVILGRSGE